MCGFTHLRSRSLLGAPHHGPPHCGVDASHVWLHTSAIQRKRHREQASPNVHGVCKVRMVAALRHRPRIDQAVPQPSTCKHGRQCCSANMGGVCTHGPCLNVGGMLPPCCMCILWVACARMAHAWGVGSMLPPCCLCLHWVKGLCACLGGGGITPRRRVHQPRSAASAHSHAIAPVSDLVLVTSNLKPNTRFLQPHHRDVGQPLLACAHGRRRWRRRRARWCVGGLRSAGWMRCGLRTSS